MEGVIADVGEAEEEFCVPVGGAEGEEEEGEVVEVCEEDAGVGEEEVEGAGARGAGGGAGEQLGGVSQLVGGDGDGIAYVHLGENVADMLGEGFVGMVRGDGDGEGEWARECGVVWCVEVGEVGVGVVADTGHGREDGLVCKDKVGEWAVGKGGQVTRVVGQM